MMAVVTARLKKYEDTKTAIAQLEKDMTKTYSDSETFVSTFTAKGDYLHYVTVLKLRREVLNHVNVGLGTDPNAVDESRPRSETSQAELETYLKTLSSGQLAMLPFSSSTKYKTLPTLHDMRAECLVANCKEDLERWSRSFLEDFHVAKQLQMCVEQSCKDLTAAESARATKEKREKDVERRRQEAEAAKQVKKAQKEKEAEERQASRTSPQKAPAVTSILDLPTDLGLSIVTVSEKDFLKMSDSEKIKLSSSMLIIRGCTALKEALATVPRLQDQMNIFAPQYSSSSQAKSTGRCVTNANANANAK